jgi:HlyD family secretion protein
MTMFRRPTGLLLAAAVLGGLAWALWPRALAVETARVALRDIAVLVEEQGRSRIREVFTVSAPIAGRMSRLGLHAGDAVIGGQTVVASISPAAPALLDARTRRIAEASRDAAEAAVALARAELARAAAQDEHAAAEFRRAGMLAERGTIPSRLLDQARLDAAAAAAALASARANLLVREREFESARAALIEGEAGAVAGGSCCVSVLAPASGRILRVLAQSEQVVAPGTPLVEIGDTADLEVVVELLSTEAVRVAQGAPARIDGWGGPPLSARVERIAPSAVTRVSALGIEEQRVTVVLALEGEPEAWAGLGDAYRVTAHIEIWRGAGLPAVPLGALFRSGADWAVFRVAEGRAVLTRIAIGERDGAWAEIRGGLAPGDEVILHPSDRVSDGVRVAPLAGPPAAG